jgi:hypothetical protein
MSQLGRVPRVEGEVVAEAGELVIVVKRPETKGFIRFPAKKVASRSPPTPARLSRVN